MPPMRMRLSVLDRKQLRRLKIGDLVRFSLGSRGDRVTIVTIEPLDRPRPDSR
jgi:Cu/Ag efflux protein CusF